MQSSLLKYWEFQPFQDEKERASQGNSKARRSQESPTSDSDRPHVGRGSNGRSAVDSWRVKWRSFRKGSKGKERESQSSVRNSQAQGEDTKTEKEKPAKKMPVSVPSICFCPVFEMVLVFAL
jgi:hypothetical protein